MAFRRILLRILFASLAAAALFGAIGVLTANHESIWRIVSTCCYTAVSAVFLLGISKLSENPRTQSTAVLGAILIVTEYFGVVALIWSLVPSGISDEVGGTLASLAAVGAAAIGFHQLRLAVSARLAGWVGLILSGVEMLLLMTAIWGDQQRWDDKWLGTAGALAAFGPLAVLCLIGATSRGVRIPWRWAGVIAAAVAQGIATYAIIMDIHDESVIFSSICSLACVVAHVNLLLLLPLRREQAWVRICTMLATAAAGVAFCVGYFQQTNGQDDAFLLRVCGAFAILAGCGTLALLILSRINRRIEASVIRAEQPKEVALECPCCQTKQVIVANGGPVGCRKCGLLFEIGLKAPTCPACEYSLLYFKGDRCPECGHAISGAPSPAIPAAVAVTA